MPRQKKYSDELLDRGARMVADSGRPITHVARDLGIHHETLCKWVRKDSLSSEEREKLKALRGGCATAPRQRDPQVGVCLFAAEFDPRATSRSGALAGGSSKAIKVPSAAQSR
jgi:transposase